MSNYIKKDFKKHIVVDCLRLSCPFHPNHARFQALLGSALGLGLFYALIW